MAKSNTIRNAWRGENYRALRAAGYSVDNANRIKSSKTGTAFALEKHYMPEINRNKQTRKPGAGLKHIPMEDYEKKYFDEYNYLVSYQNKKEPGKLEFITIVSNIPLYKKDVIAQARQVLKQDMLKKYKMAKITSLKIEYVVINKL